MERYISADEVVRRCRDEAYSIEIVGKGYSGVKGLSVGEINRIVDGIPAEEVKKRNGEWIPIADGDGAECSECGEYYDTEDEGFKEFTENYHYCPSCGAKMETEDTDV